MAIPKKVREKLRERSSGDPLLGLCEICGRPANNAHHRRNQSQQGRDVLSNLIMLCGSGVTGCHGAVTANPNWAEDRGYTIKGTEVAPADVPVHLWWGAVGRDPVWVFLGDDGSIAPYEQKAS